ncbi:MAG TPA: sigma-70 family RNA polymerase sigma factor [Candidatus Binatia bacterium]|nr:sigma-70 family RNA polymerase sigma factor [Candidatus Binatia bacterium]
MEDSVLRELAVRSASGEMDALESLIRGFHPSLFSYLHLLGVPPSDVDEIAQQVVINMYQSLRGYRSDQPFLPWLRSIARHSVSNYWRSRRRDQHRRGVFASYLSEVFVEAGEAVPETPSSRLRECMERLQDKHREMVRLRYFQNLDSSRISEKVGLSAVAVRQALSRIREILRACVKSSPTLKTT